MGIVISCFGKVGGTGISNVLFHTARAAYRTGALDAVICYGSRQTEIPARFIRPIRFQPVRLVSFLKARYYYTLKRMALDGRTAGYLRRRGCDLFHGWTTECLRSLEAAKRIGARTIVERPAPAPATAWRLLREEYERWGVPFPRDDGSRWLRRIDWAHHDAAVAPREFALADRIIVQSEFGARSFAEAGISAAKMVILPRAVDLHEFAASEEAGPRPFRVLYVGSVCLRKGFLDLLRAWKELDLPDAELWVVGGVHDEIVPFIAPHRDDPAIRFFGHLPRGAAEMFREAAVFVLPSITEGSAKTTYEAMAAGLPVVTTRNAGSVVRDGTDGYIVPIRDPDAIRDRLLHLYRHRELARAMGRSAREQVARFSWEAYEARLGAIYGELLGDRAAAGTAGLPGDGGKG